MRIVDVHIEGFRSLKDLSLMGLQSATVVHGDNNSGKSNIVAFLDLLFCSKQETGPTVLAMTSGESNPTVPKTARKTPWSFGEITNFTDNYFLNNYGPITFEVTVELDSADIAVVTRDIDKAALPTPLEAPNMVSASGSITRSGPDIARMFVNRLMLADYDLVHPEEIDKDEFTLSEDLRSALVDGLNEMLTDSVTVIGSQRFVTTEREDRSLGCEVTSGQLKNGLFNLSLDKSRHQEFDRIRQWFAGAPFSYGEISFARTGDGDQQTLQVMVEKNDLRLPIDRLGSGIQQTLAIIAHLNANPSARVYAIEEPEANLSPESQRVLLERLISLISEPGFPVSQMILTSHSPIFSQQSLAKVMFVKMSGGCTCLGDTQEVPQFMSSMTLAMENWN